MSVVQTIEKDFISVLKFIGKESEQGLGFAVKYAIPVEKLVAMFFPQATPAAVGIFDALALTQKAIFLVEQKYATDTTQNASGQKKLADVLTLSEDAVTSLLAKEGITANTAKVTSIVNAVVAVLNVQDVNALPVAA